MTQPRDTTEPNGLPAPADRAKRRFDAEAQAEFCRLVAEGNSTAAACRLLGVARSQPYDTAKVDEAFRAAWDEARETGADLLEDIAFKLATEGGEDVEYDANGAVRRRTKRAPNPAILARVLQAWRPDRWGDKPAVAVAISAPAEVPTHRLGLTIDDPLRYAVKRDRDVEQLYGSPSQMTVGLLRSLAHSGEEFERLLARVRELEHELGGPALPPARLELPAGEILEEEEA